MNLKGQMGLFSGREGDAGYLRQSWSILGQLGSASYPIDGVRNGVSAGTWQWWEIELLRWMGILEGQVQQFGLSLSREVNLKASVQWLG